MTTIGSGGRSWSKLSAQRLGRLLQVDVHLSPEFVTEWLEPD
jgi:hypothetical protein